MLPSMSTSFKNFLPEKSLKILREERCGWLASLGCCCLLGLRPLLTAPKLWGGLILTTAELFPLLSLKDCSGVVLDCGGCAILLRCKSGLSSSNADLLFSWILWNSFLKSHPPTPLIVGGSSTAFVPLAGFGLGESKNIWRILVCNPDFVFKLFEVIPKEKTI